MKAILILTDFSENAFRAAEYVCTLAGPLRVDRVVLYRAYQTVIVGTDMPATLDGSQIYIDSMQQLRLVRDRLKPMLAGYNPNFHFVQGEDIADRILALSHDFQASMIVTIHRQHGFFSSLFRQRISKKLIYDSQIPLLSLPDLS